MTTETMTGEMQVERLADEEISDFEKTICQAITAHFEGEPEDEVQYQAMFQKLLAELRASRSRPLEIPPYVRPTPEPILQFFAYEHLPPHLAAISAEFSTLAHLTIMNQPRSAERTVALRKLLESKDAAVRAALAK